MSAPKLRMYLSTPCENRWAELPPRDGGRYCAQCDRVVVDLMHLTEREATRRFEEAGGDLCGRMREDAAGDGVFRHEPSSRKGVGAVVLSAALAAACGGGSDEPAAAPIEAAEVVEPTVVETAPDDFHVLEEEDGSDHPAHDGVEHSPVHHVEHGRMGGISRRIPRNGERPGTDDPLEGLEGL